MSQDRKATAEARALQACIQVTEDPVEQNRLWNRYYKLSDEVFPEAAVLHQRYRTMEGAERQRFKTEYMELVRRLWAATDEAAAYPVSFSQTPAVAPTPRFQPPPPVVPPSPSHTPQRTSRWAFATLFVAAVAIGSVVLWQYGQTAKSRPDSTPAVESASLTIDSPRPPTSSPVPVAAPPEITTRESTEAPEFRVPVDEIEAAVAREIVPEFSPIPSVLKGKGDRVTYAEGVFEDVYVMESEALYYVRIPERGSVESIAKEGATARISADNASREALLAIWKQNREEIDRVNAARADAKNLRTAAYRKDYDQQVAEHNRAQEEERWRVRMAEWLGLGPEQRNALRVRAYSNWEAVQLDVEKVRELYFNISRAYVAIGITDSRVGRLSASYKASSRYGAPDFGVENALIQYGWEREDWIRMLAEWEKEYYRLTAYLNETYPEIEKRVAEIKRLDDSLPPDVRVAEATVNWDAAAEASPPAESTGGTGTGFIVAKGYVMTCAHVVRGGSKVSVSSPGGTVFNATVKSLDTSNDWALLQVDGLEGEPIPAAQGKPNVGATIYCIGYPLGGIKDSTDPIVGSGNIAALQRLDGDQRFMQITAPVNPGNSGGPVLDQYGNWVGMVSQKLNDLATLRAAETVTQGVNFAVKSSFIQPLIDPRNSVQLALAPPSSGQPMSLETMVQRVSASIVKIEVR